MSEKPYQECADKQEKRLISGSFLGDHLEHGTIVVDNLDEQRLRVSPHKRLPWIVIETLAEESKAVVYVSDVIALLDSAGLNTTANELGAKLDERIIELENTIASLRQRDTVRPEVDLAAVWDRGWRAHKDGDAKCNNPHR